MGVSEELLAALLPGPVTVILPKRKPLPVSGDTLGIRVPDADWIRSLAREAGALALTSANVSGGPSPVSVDGIGALADNAGIVAFDAGTISGDARGSTIVTLNGPAQTFRVVR